jgi:hypothetical protein
MGVLCQRESPDFVVPDRVAGTGTVIYRMQSMSVTPNRAVLAVENASPIPL